MRVDQMREAIRKVYPGQGWQFKVDQMSDAQVIAVYKRFLNEKKL